MDMFPIMCTIAVIVAVFKVVLRVAAGVPNLKAARFANSHTAEEWHDMDSAAFMEGKMQFQRQMQVGQQRQVGQDFADWQREQQRFMDDMQFQQFMDDSLNECMNFGMLSVTPFDMGGFL